MAIYELGAREELPNYLLKLATHDMMDTLTDMPTLTA